MTQNGNYLTTKWLVGILLSIVAFGIAGFISTTMARISDVEDSETNTATRVTRLEENRISIDTRLKNIETMLSEVLKMRGVSINKSP